MRRIVRWGGSSLVAFAAILMILVTIGAFLPQDDPPPTDAADAATTRPSEAPSTPTLAQTPPPAPTPDGTAQTIADQETILFSIRSVTTLSIESLQIADDRALGGDKSIIIAMMSQASSQDELLGELGRLWGAVGTTIRAQQMDADVVVVVIGDSSGSAVGTVAVTVPNLVAFVNGTLSAEDFFRTWDVANF